MLNVLVLIRCGSFSTYTSSESYIVGLMLFRVHAHSRLLAEGTSPDPEWFTVREMGLL